ncbi:MAG TPA: response regulator transcription factor [Candidatus Acidoferrum sp.]
MRIVIADDHEVVRRGVCSILESRRDLEVIGEAVNGADAIQKALELRPDLVILDVSMPILDGFAAARQINKNLPQVPILMLSMHDGKEMVRASKSAGAQGFVTKTEVGSTLLTAVDILLKGGSFFSDLAAPK